MIWWSWCSGKRPHSSFYELLKGVETGKLFPWCPVWRYCSDASANLSTSWPSHATHQLFPWQTDRRHACLLVWCSCSSSVLCVGCRTWCSHRIGNHELTVSVRSLTPCLCARLTALCKPCKVLFKWLWPLYRGSSGTKNECRWHHPHPFHIHMGEVYKLCLSVCGPLLRWQLHLAASIQQLLLTVILVATCMQSVIRVWRLL